MPVKTGLDQPSQQSTVPGMPATRAEAKAKADAIRTESAADARIRAADAAAERKARERRDRDRHKHDLRKQRRAEKRAAEADRRRRRELAQTRRTARVRAVGRALRGTVGHDRFTETLFYATVLVVALAGQVGAASRWLHWPVLFAAGAVMALELGGVVLLHWSYKRRKLGERTLFASVLSAAVAAFAVGFNFFGHFEAGKPTVAGGFFAVMSALGYLVWVMLSAARVRDARRADGEMVVPPPAYGVWRWVRHPVLTRLAAELHGRDPGLGLYGSLDAAKAEIDAAAKRKRVAKLVKSRLREAFGKKDRVAADFAIEQYDPDRVAAMLIERADYQALVSVLDSQLLSPQRAAAIVGDVLNVEPLALPAEPHQEGSSEVAGEASSEVHRPASEPAGEVHRSLTSEPHHDLTEKVVSEPQRSTRDQRKPASPVNRRDRGKNVPPAARKKAPSKARTDEELLTDLDKLFASGELTNESSVNQVRLALGCGSERAQKLLDIRANRVSGEASEDLTSEPHRDLTEASPANLTGEVSEPHQEGSGEVHRPRLAVIRRDAVDEFGDAVEDLVEDLAAVNE